MTSTPSQIYVMKLCEKNVQKKDSRLDHRSEGLTDARLIYSDNQKPELIYD